MDLKFSKLTRKGPITIVTLSRPEVYNALHIDAHFELNKIFDDFSADPEQWVAIVTGAGDKAFCAGNDLKWQAAGGKRGWDKGGFAGLTTRFDCDKPIIAAVNGVAMGGGFEIALACDLIIASENATFALPEPRVGLAALAGGLHRLPRQIGLKRAMGMILTARHVSAKEGHELGFVNEVVPAGEALAAARTLGRDDLQELADVDPRLQADHPEGPRRLAGTGDGRAARLPGREGDGGVAGLYRGTEGVFGKAPAEMGGEVGHSRPSPGIASATRTPTCLCTSRTSRLRSVADACPGNDGVMLGITFVPSQLPPIRRIVRLIDRELVHRGLPEMISQSRRLQIDLAVGDLVRSARFSSISEPSMPSSRVSRAASAASLPSSNVSCRVTRSSMLIATRSLNAL